MSKRKANVPEGPNITKCEGPKPKAKKPKVLSLDEIVFNEGTPPIDLIGEIMLNHGHTVSISRQVARRQGLVMNDDAVLLNIRSYLVFMSCGQYLEDLADAAIKALRKKKGKQLKRVTTIYFTFKGEKMLCEIMDKRITFCFMDER